MKNKILIGLTAAIIPLAANAGNVLPQEIWGPGLPGTSGGPSEMNLYLDGAGPYAGKTGELGIMEYLYGNDFTRLNDSSVVEWEGLSGTVDVNAVYAGAGQHLYTTAPGGSPTSGAIINPGGTIGGTPSISLETATFTPVTSPFLFLDDTTPSGYAKAYSDPTLNAEFGGIPKGTVRMVAFQVTGSLDIAGDLSGGYTSYEVPTYVIAFEDGTDMDYNDLVVQVSGVRPVPDGGFTVGLLGMGVLGLGWIRRRMVK